MKQFYTTITVARGITVFLMPAIHTVMLFSQPAIYNACWVWILRFFAEGPGAQLFMFIMGFLIATGRERSGRYRLQRSLLLLIVAYLLNFFRIYLPARLQLYNPVMLGDYQAGEQPHPYVALLLTGDILQFAAIAYGLIGWLRLIRVSGLYFVILFILIAICAPLVWGLRSDHWLTDHLLGLLCANDHRAFFPLFPWLCYPIAGAIAGSFLQPGEEHSFFLRLAGPGLSLMIIGIITMYITPIHWEGDFYRSSPGRTIAYTGFVLLWLYTIHRFHQSLSPHLFVIRLFSFCGRHITFLYCFHWLLIGWSLPLFGYHQLNEKNSVLAVVLISCLSLGVPFLFYRLRSYHLSKNPHSSAPIPTYETNPRI